MDMNEKTKQLADILEAFINGALSLDAARQRVRRTCDEVTADELALAEQALFQRGLKDTDVYNHIESFLLIFQDVLRMPDLHLADWHPIRTYQRENEAVEAVIAQAQGLSRSRFVPNQWAEVMEALKAYKTHLSRKQNQLYPAFERHGFDRPSKIMWTLDDAVRDALRSAGEALAGSPAAFLEQYDSTVALLRELMEKENMVLYPAAVEMIPVQDFLAMRAGDDEIGYCLIDPPPKAPVPGGGAPKAAEAAAATPATAGFMEELQALLQKHGAASAADVLDVRQGKLTLEQINLIFRHLPVDLSFVDENELVRFYSDTRHRVFPRSPGVIGRDVKNCHPRESLQTVEEIIRAFREGREDEAEFWLEMNGKFVYIIYVAVRDDAGSFRGVLEMMQDVTHIRSLRGTRRLPAWKVGDAPGSAGDAGQAAPPQSAHGFAPDTTIGEVVKRYPAVRAWLPTLSPKYKKLLNPVAFKAMAGIATLEMVAARGGFTTGQLIEKLDEWADAQTPEPPA